MLNLSHQSSMDSSSSFMDQSLSSTSLIGRQPQQQQMVPPQQMMEASRVPADRRLLEQPWKDPRFFPITMDTVMQYFCQRENPFYDTNSDNALVMMQNPGISGPQLDEILKKATGIQFVLVQSPSAPPLFVIRKQQRMSVDKITPLCHYYILDGTVYQAPDMHTFLHSRLVSIMDPLRNAFSEAVEMLRFTPSKGYFWEFKTKPAKRAADEDGSVEEAEGGELMQQMQQQHSKEAEKEEDPLSVRATPYQRLRTDMLLQELAAQFMVDAGPQPAVQPQQSRNPTGAR